MCPIVIYTAIYKKNTCTSYRIYRITTAYSKHSNDEKMVHTTEARDGQYLLQNSVSTHINDASGKSLKSKKSGGMY